MDVTYVYRDVTDAQHDSAAEKFDTELPTLFEFMVKTQQSIAGREEVARVLENVKADQITAEERLQDHLPMLKHPVDVTRREG